MLEVVENDYNAIVSIAVTAYFVIYVCSTITMTTIIKRIKAKKVLITRGGACICSHTGPDILAISCSN